jgi:hypothetical protein
MSGVGTAAVTNNDIIMLSEDIDNFPFAFVAPLQSGNARIHLVLYL